MAERSEETMTEAGPEDDRAELRRMIDVLMSGPPREWPAIIVVGDDDVSAIYPPPSGG